mgnify:CR=1 FL=1
MLFRSADTLELRVGSSTIMRSLGIGEGITIPFESGPIATCIYVKSADYEDGVDELTVKMYMIGTEASSLWANNYSFHNAEAGNQAAQLDAGFKTAHGDFPHQTAGALFDDGNGNVPMCGSIWMKGDIPGKSMNSLSPFKLWFDITNGTWIPWGSYGHHMYIAT